MKRTLKIALSAVLGAALVVPAIAQDAFPDTPENHWAYEALREMKNNGLLVGYPDGLFRGPRPASRYEMAVAIHATYKHLKNITDGLDGRINDLKKTIDGWPKGGGGSTVSQTEIDNLKKALSDLQGQMGSMKAWGTDIANLKKMAGTFEKELSSMGVDVEALKKGMSDLADRVSVLEKRKLPVDIHGDLTFVALGGYSDDPSFGVTWDGRPTGVGSGSYAGAPVGATRDLSVFHEAGLSLTGTNDEGPKWGVTLVTGTALEGFGNQSQIMGGVNFDDNVSSDVYIHDAWVKFDTSLVGQNFGATAGRFGVKTGAYTMQRIDNTPYFKNSRWDDGEWSIDGAQLNFNFGGAQLGVFGGRNSDRRSVNGNELQPMMAGQSGIMVDRTLGANLNIPLTSNGALNLTYLWLDTDTVVGGVNRVNVMGADAKLKVGAINLEGGYSKTDEKYNSTSVNTTDNTAMWVKAGLSGSKWGVKGWYRDIEENFAAPGAWGRIGWFYNPTNIKGYGAGAHFDLTSNVTLWGSYEMYEPSNGAGNDVTSAKAGLGYKLGSSSHLDLGYERVQFDFAGADPFVNWFNVGFGHNLGGNSTFNVLWQISDFDGKGNITTPFGAGLAKGGLITTQLSVKF